MLRMVSGMTVEVDPPFKTHYLLTVMSTLDIITVPDPVLKETAHSVDRVDEAVRRQMDNMLETMYAAPGIGLAANQVNILNRVLVMNVDPESWKYGPEVDGILPVQSRYRSGLADPDQQQARYPLPMANPEVIWRSEQKSIFEEGCLSIPGIRGRTSTSRAGSMVPVATTMRSIVARSTSAVGPISAASPPPQPHAKRPAIAW